MAASILVDPVDGTSPVRIELLGTTPGDPLVPVAITRNDDVVLTSSAAARLHAGVGAVLTGRLGRTRDHQQQRVTVPLRVVAVAAPAAYVHEAAFVALPLAIMIENYQDNVADFPADVGQATVQPRSTYAGFRLYADRLEDVPALDRRLRSEGSGDRLQSRRGRQPRRGRPKPDHAVCGRGRAGRVRASSSHWVPGYGRMSNASGSNSRC